jgi:hypothetical protein
MLALELLKQSLYLDKNRFYGEKQVLGVILTLIKVSA